MQKSDCSVSLKHCALLSLIGKFVESSEMVQVPFHEQMQAYVENLCHTWIMNYSNRWFHALVSYAPYIGL